MTYDVNLKRFQTCSTHPLQYEMYLPEIAAYLYFRERHGVATVNVAGTEDDAIMGMGPSIYFDSYTTDESYDAESVAHAEWAILAALKACNCDPSKASLPS